MRARISPTSSGSAIGGGPRSEGMGGRWRFGALGSNRRKAELLASPVPPDWWPWQASHRNPVVRFWRKVDTTGPGCWHWLAARTPDGHGKHFDNGAFVYAHRYVIELTTGVRPDAGLVIRHLCDNPPCCRPDHLTIGTVADNVADMIVRGRFGRGTHCRHGHERTLANTYTYGNGRRRCLLCMQTIGKHPGRA